MARSMAATSNPWCSQKRASSEAITERTMVGEIRSIGVQR
jgi:hypothetical protein